MTRVFLLRTLSVAALTAGLAPATAQASTTTPAIINGGGATSPQYEYAGAGNPTTKAPAGEFSVFNAGDSAVNFGTYWGPGSGTGQKAFLLNDLTCDIDGQTGANSGSCIGPVGGANTVHYGTSDNPLSAAQISSWTNSTVGQAVAGNLIQLPTYGTGTAIGVVNSAIKKNGALTLSDGDLCGIFSGLYTNWNQITDSKTAPAAGTITVVYRTDTSAPTFLLTNHLHTVCADGTHTPTGFTFTGTTNFGSLFPHTTVGSLTTITGGALVNPVGEKLNQGVANYLAGLTGTPPTSAIGFLAPDWTSIVTTSGNTLSNNLPSTVLVAALTGSGTVAYTPTEKNIALGLANPGAGATNQIPPSSAATAALPANWIPTIPLVVKGYPIVGYGTIDLAQCYANKTVQSGLVQFLTDHYSNATYTAIQTADGVVPLTNTKAAKFKTVLLAHMLSDGKPQWNTNLGNATACAGLPGR